MIRACNQGIVWRERWYVRVPSFAGRWLYRWRTQSHAANRWGHPTTRMMIISARRRCHRRVVTLHMSNYLRLALLVLHVLSSLLVAWLPVFRSCIPYVSVHVDLENCHTHVHVPHLQQSSVLTCKHIQCACVRPQILPSPKQIETKRRGNVQIFLTVSAFDDALHVLVDIQSVHTNNKHIHSGAEVSICLFEFSCC